jgi:hypothetical protein
MTEWNAESWTRYKVYSDSSNSLRPSKITGLSDRGHEPVLTSYPAVDVLEEMCLKAKYGV